MIETDLPTSSTTRTRLDALLAEYQGLWTALDTLLDDLTPEDWSKKLGKAWVYADLPYHLTYFDCELVASYLKPDADLTVADRWLMADEPKVDAWNARMFARRPAAQTISQTLAAMRAARAAVLRSATTLTDADLNNPAWNPFFGGVTLQDVLIQGIAHTWSHACELRLRRRHRTVAFPPAAVHRAYGYFMDYMARIPSAEALTGQPFSVGFSFTGPGGGDWTISLGHGRCEATATRAPTDVRLTMSPETFIRMTFGITSPLILTLTRKIKIQGFRNMSTFVALFPANKPGHSWRTSPDVLSSAGEIT